MLNKVLAIWTVSIVLGIPGPGAEVGKRASEGSSGQIWKDPGNMGSRDLYYGPGGKSHLPHGDFVFVREDPDGSSPKFIVTDSAGAKWKVKLGSEARPETASTRLVWSAGYFTDENYFFPRLQVRKMPAKLHRGQESMSADGSIPDARLERDFDGEEKLHQWNWRHNPFLGTREFNGLRVMMALINNWDLKDDNNATYSPKSGGQETYVVSDLGTAFGAPGFAHPTLKARNNIETYSHSKFITRVTPDFVDFSTPQRPPLIRLTDVPDFINRLHMRWIGKHIPKGDAAWIGHLLSGLSHQQIADAFRAAGYSPTDVEAFSDVVQGRIRELDAL